MQLVKRVRGAAWHSWGSKARPRHLKVDTVLAHYRLCSRFDSAVHSGKEECLKQQGIHLYKHASSQQGTIFCITWHGSTLRKAY